MRARTCTCGPTHLRKESTLPADDRNNKSGPRFWAFVIASYAVAATVLALLHAPSASLLAGVIAGAVAALVTGEGRQLPGGLQGFGLAVVGVAAGSQIDAGVVRLVLDKPAEILGSVLVTMAVTMAFGQLLRLSPAISATTAAFASIAGAASGVTGVVREVGGDDAVVMAIQYLRVIAVLVSVPVAAHALGGHQSSAQTGTQPTVTDFGGWSGATFAVICLVLGMALTRRLSFSGSRIVLPLLVATGLSLSGVFTSTAVPPQLLVPGYAFIGLAAGVSLSPATVRLLVRSFPLIGGQLLLGLIGCAVTGVLFAKAAGMSPLDGYLASTPGGLPAVTAVAIGSGASAGVIITIQLVRVFIALLLASALGALFSRCRGPEAPGRDTAPS